MLKRMNEKMFIFLALISGPMHPFYNEQNSSVSKFLIFMVAVRLISSDFTLFLIHYNWGHGILIEYWIFLLCSQTFNHAINMQAIELFWIDFLNSWQGQGDLTNKIFLGVWPCTIIANYGYRNES